MLTQEQVIENYVFLFFQDWGEIDAWDVCYAAWKETGCFRGHRIVDGVEFFLTFAMSFKIPVDYDLMDPLVVQAAAANLPFLNVEINPALFDEVKKWLPWIAAGILIGAGMYYLVCWLRTPEIVPEPEIVPVVLVEVPWEHLVPWWLIVPLSVVIVVRLVWLRFQSK